MYSIKNGVLYKDGRPTIGMGAGYYASFHRYKWPVPPDGDRVGEAEKDLAEMREIGFNMIRTSALGDFRWEDGQVKGEFPFAEKLCEIADKNDLSVLLRSQGYSAVMRHKSEDVRILNYKREPIEFQKCFVSDCINHPGVIEDNDALTEFIAKHFSKYKNIVLHLMYNEPGYPYDEGYDFHPESIKAYRKWLVDNGYRTEKEVENLEPPHHRPNRGESEEEWILFHEFKFQAMSRFLCDSGRASDRGNPNTESLTCTMPLPLQEGGTTIGEDIFDMGDGMDIIGVTDYCPYIGLPAYFTYLYSDTLNSAARMNGKHVWAAECNAHTAVTITEWQRETYGLLGSGFKGLLYYQWRADYDNGKGPEIGMFGILHNDRTHSQKYDIIKGTNALVERLSETLATSDRISSDIGILYSRHANTFFDAHENGWIDPEVAWDAFENFDPGTFVFKYNHNIDYLGMIHRELRQRQIAPNIVRASDLKENKLGIKTLFVPSATGLGAEELDMINEFAKNGGYVFSYQPQSRTNGFTLNCHSTLDCDIKREKTIPKNLGRGVMGAIYSYDDVLYATNYKYRFKISSELDKIMYDVLENGRCYTVSFVNVDSFERAEKSCVLSVDASLVSDRAKFHTVTREIEVKGELVGDKMVFKIPEIRTGCFFMIDKK